MRKYFAIFLSVCVLVSLVALTGCSLWGYDDDDDVVAPEATMKAFGIVDLPGDGKGDLKNLRGAAVTLADSLKAQAWERTMVGGIATETVAGPEVDVNSDDGSYTVTFPVKDSYYFVKITSGNNANFTMLAMLGLLEPTKDTTKIESKADVTPTTTLVGSIILKTTDQLIRPEDVATDTVEFTTMLTTLTNTLDTTTGDGNVAAVDETIAVAVTGVTLKPTSTGIKAGATETLTATVAPTYATNKAVTWASSNTAVATVNNGVVTGVAVGVATISVTLNSDTTKKAECLVTVSEVPVTGVTLDNATLALYVGDSSTLTATVAPANAANKTVAWTSTDDTIASVTNGVVKGLAAGVATITVTTADGGFTAKCTVTVSVKTTTSVTLQGTVSGRALSEVLIKITGVAADFTTTTSLPDTASTPKTWVLSKDADLTTTYGTLILRAQADTNGTAVTLADGFTLFADFNALTFTTGLPTGAQVFILNQGTDPVSTVTQSNVL